MKAWKCSTYDDIVGELAVIVWADTSGKAKSFATDNDQLGEPEFTQIHCKRAKWADGMQSMLETDFQIEELKHGWVWCLEQGEEINSSTLPMIEKYGGTIDTFAHAYEETNAPIQYGENGFYEEVKTCKYKKQ